jgi:hypothetical protein
VNVQQSSGKHVGRSSPFHPGQLRHAQASESEGVAPEAPAGALPPEAIIEKATRGSKTLDTLHQELVRSRRAQVRLLDGQTCRLGR